MQNFNLIQGQDRVKNSREKINENFETVASNFSGDAFPTGNLYVGMKCYRTDLKATYTLLSVDPVQWEEDASGKLKNARNISLSGKAKSEPSAFDGTTDISIQVTSVEADSCTGNSVTATTAAGVKGVVATQNAPRHVWFSSTRDEMQREHANNFMFNPVTGTLAVPQLEGTATNATRASLADRATADANGANIPATYTPKTGVGATGTWGINITGKAETAGRADTAARADTSDTAERAKAIAGNVLVFGNGTKIWVE